MTSIPLPSSDFHLSSAQKAHFLAHGFVKIPSCFTRTQAAEFTSGLWTRLGISPTDKSTWTQERINMPTHRKVNAKEFAPKAWIAMCELLGGEERIATEDGKGSWGDGFILNLGKAEYDEKQEIGYRQLDNWHIDGDFFVHFLDSREQALLVIPLWSDIKPKGGGTALCTDGIRHIAQHLYDRPEGTSPWLKSINDPEHATYLGGEVWTDLATDPEKTNRESFFEATGEVGDVYLLHPLMLHSASKNLTREVRVITNPPVSLKEPFNFDRGEEDGEYSLVELKTIGDLGMEGGLKGWKIKGERKAWVPERFRTAKEMKMMELERLEKAADGITQDSVLISGE